MSIFNLYSKRQKALNEKPSDVYAYDDIPQPLRVQIVHIWRDSLGSPDDYNTWQRRPSHLYKMMNELLCREYGWFQLPSAEKYGDRDYYTELCKFLLTEKDINKVIDVIEVTFRAIDVYTRNWEYRNLSDADEVADNAIDELNNRFQEHTVGYQFTDGNIIRIDSELVHTEVVKPALILLHQIEYKGAQEEFLKAHKHYRNGHPKDVLVECLKALESTIKAICDKRKWKYPATATANTLIQLCFDKGLIPTFWSSHFTALRSTLESGVPTARNKLGGHGQGSTVTDVPSHIAAYVLHLTASCIIFLVEADNALK